MITTAAFLRGGWKRKIRSEQVTHMTTFVSKATDSNIIDDSQVRVLSSPADGGEIVDPTICFKDGEMDVLILEAKHIAKLAANGARVLVVCRGGKNRSAFLAHLAKAHLDEAGLRSVAFDANLPVCDMLKKLLLSYRPKE